VYAQAKHTHILIKNIRVDTNLDLERKKERKNVYLSSSHLKQHCFYSKHIEFIAQERLAGGLFFATLRYIRTVLSGR
jgi:homoserine trans-succinylase